MSIRYIMGNKADIISTRKRISKYTIYVLLYLFFTASVLLLLILSGLNIYEGYKAQKVITSLSYTLTNKQYEKVKETNLYITQREQKNSGYRIKFSWPRSIKKIMISRTYIYSNSREKTSLSIMSMAAWDVIENNQRYMLVAVISKLSTEERSDLINKHCKNKKNTRLLQKDHNNLSEQKNIDCLYTEYNYQFVHLWMRGNIMFKLEMIDAANIYSDVELSKSSVLYKMVQNATLEAIYTKLAGSKHE